MNKKLQFLLFVFIGSILAGCGLSFGYEVDDFTERNTLHQDSLEIMDQEVNQILDRALKVSNKESPRYCNRVLLRSEIIRWIRPDPAGQLEMWANFTKKLNQTKTSFRESIYGDVSFSDAPALWFVGIGKSYRLAGQMTGTDKIGHFFMQGLDYFKRVQDGKTIEQVMTSDHGEDGAWGLGMTGVKSYADMSANFAGYQFWNQLTEGKNPYFKCEMGKGWYKTRNFSWADYVTPAWDEGINCSEMRPSIQSKVDRRLTQMKLTCPVEPIKCFEISRLDKSEYYMSPKCQSVVKLFKSITHSTQDKQIATRAQGIFQ